MAHVKASGSKAHQGGNVAGKRLGLKVGAGQQVRAGAIIIRQRGTRFYPGRNAKRTRNDDIIATIDGIVRFEYINRPRGRRVIVHIDP